MKQMALFSFLTVCCWLTLNPENGGNLILQNIGETLHSHWPENLKSTIFV
jgi:hypothetical protein